MRGNERNKRQNEKRIGPGQRIKENHQIRN